MNVIGIISEYNPFHNGHIHHINEIKKKYPDSTIVCAMSGNFVQRGEVSIIDKWDKTKIALKYGVDLVVEIPYFFSTESADKFAYASVNILNHLKVDKIIFGSESNNIDKLTNLASYTLTDEYHNKVKNYMSDGISYPSACSKALGVTLRANDILGLSYIKEAMKLNSNIEFETIKRTNEYHSKELSEISSATAIREAISNNIDISHYVPKEVIDVIKKHAYTNDDYFNLLKYKIITSKDLSIYQTVDEGIEFKILKNIDVSNSFDELIKNIKSKRYTYHKLSRMLIHILCGFTKEEANSLNKVDYIRILGFNNQGRLYLNKVKSDIQVDIISKYTKIPGLELERRVSNIYYGKDLEYKNKLIIKEK